MITITLFKNIYDKSGITVCGSFGEICEYLKDANKTEEKRNLDTVKLYNKCFVRTGCYGPRKDSNCDSGSNLIVIDVDRGISGDVIPVEVHNSLKEQNINHLIYTSWGNMVNDLHKFRILIPTDLPYSKSDLKQVNKMIMKMLSDLGHKIVHVKEMDSYSQPWFYGRYIQEYECYEYYDGQDMTVEISAVVADADSGCDIPAKSRETKEQMYENIRTGKEFHESLRTLSFQMIKDGVSNADVKAYLKSAMNGSCEAGSERWQKRYDDIDRMVDGVNQGEEESNWEIKSSNSERRLKTVPKAPGLMGQFMTELEEFMNYRDETIAFVSSIFICSSIIGRKFNVDINDSEGRGKPTALNMYLTLAAETGSGKSEIEDAVENCYMQFSGANGNIQDFFFKGRVSGPRALYKRYRDMRVMGFIQNEKGIAGQSSLGDQQGMKDAWLNLYGQGAWNKWSGAAGFTDSDTDVKSIRGVAISYVGESTPVELRKAYSKGDQVANGTIPREMIFTLGSLNTKPNRNIRKEYSKKIVERFIELINICHTEAGLDMYQPIIITSASEADRERMLDLQEWYRNKQNSGEDVLERAMSSRAFVKMLRLAGICTVINKGLNHARICYIDGAEWEWAKSVVEYEYANMEQIVNLTSASDDLGAAVRYACTKIVQLLDGTIKNNELKLDAMSRSVKSIPCNYLKKAIRTASAVTALDVDFKRAYKVVTGADKVISHMIELGIISKAEKNPFGRGDRYRVLSAINEYI